MRPANKRRRISTPDDLPSHSKGFLLGPTERAEQINALVQLLDLSEGDLLQAALDGAARALGLRPQPLDHFQERDRTRLWVAAAVELRWARSSWWQDTPEPIAMIGRFNNTKYDYNLPPLAGLTHAVRIIYLAGELGRLPDYRMPRILHAARRDVETMIKLRWEQRLQEYDACCEAWSDLTYLQAGDVIRIKTRSEEIPVFVHARSARKVKHDGVGCLARVYVLRDRGYHPRFYEGLANSIANSSQHPSGKKKTRKGGSELTLKYEAYQGDTTEQDLERLDRLKEKSPQLDCPRLENPAVCFLADLVLTYDGYCFARRKDSQHRARWAVDNNDCYVRKLKALATEVLGQLMPVRSLVDCVTSFLCLHRLACQCHPPAG